MAIIDILSVRVRLELGLGLHVVDTYTSGKKKCYAKKLNIAVK